MIEIQGNILELDAGIIFHGCNCSGGFASGLAGQIAELYPEVKKTYESLFVGYDSKKIDSKPALLGQVQFCRCINQQELYIINGFTQIKYGRILGERYADPSAIEKCLIQARIKIDSLNRTRPTGKPQYKRLHTVRVGCGLGGLRWLEDVKPIFEKFDKESENFELVVWNK